MTNALCSVSSSFASFSKELFRRSNYTCLVAFLNSYSNKSSIICFEEVATCVNENDFKIELFTSVKIITNSVTKVDTRN